jgi:hypothetical protein
MNRIWKTIRGYIFWTYERGTLHYDIMVSVILLFIFVTPYYVDFKDKPAERTPHQTGVVVIPEGNGFVYQIRADAVHATDDAGIRAELVRIVEPISGEVELLRWEPQRDRAGRVTTYKAWVQRR